MMDLLCLEFGKRIVAYDTTFVLIQRISSDYMLVAKESDSFPAQTFLIPNAAVQKQPTQTVEK